MSTTTDKRNDDKLVRCPRCGGDGGDRYLCGLCEGQGRVANKIAKEWRLKERR